MLQFSKSRVCSTQRSSDLVLAALTCYNIKIFCLKAQPKNKLQWIFRIYFFTGTFWNFIYSKILPANTSWNIETFLDKNTSRVHHHANNFWRRLDQLVSRCESRQRLSKEVGLQVLTWPTLDNGSSKKIHSLYLTAWKIDPLYRATAAAATKWSKVSHKNKLERSASKTFFSSSLVDGDAAASLLLGFDDQRVEFFSRVADHLEH